MQKTIEERAAEAFSMPEQPCLEAGVRDVMVKFAKEQQDIDIENAWSWMRDHIRLIGSPMELHAEFTKFMKKEPKYEIYGEFN